MALTHFDLKNAKPDSRPYKLFDGGGLYLAVQPSGRAFWRLKYRFMGKEQLLSFGEYPLFSLAEARAKRDERWAKSGIWQKMFAMLATEADNEYAMIDSTIVRAHQHSAGAQKTGEDQAIGLSKGGLSTKIHALVDALGNPLGFLLTLGQAHDLEGADALLPEMAAGTLLADKALDAEQRVIAPLLAQGKSFVIPPKRNRKIQREFDKDAYKARHLIENFFCKLKQYRAIATRYDKTARNFLAAIRLAAAIVWLN